MKELITFSQLEEVLRTAIKLSRFSAREIADKILMTSSGMYCFTTRKNHISISKGDEIIAFLKDNDPLALDASIHIHCI